MALVHGCYVTTESDTTNRVPSGRCSYRYCPVGWDWDDSYG